MMSKCVQPIFPPAKRDSILESYAKSIRAAKSPRETPKVSLDFGIQKYF